MNGSGTQPASMLPASSWACTSGNATSTNSIVVGVAAVVLDGLHDRDVARSAEAVDRDLLAREILRARDARSRPERRPR